MRSWLGEDLACDRPSGCKELISEMELHNNKAPESLAILGCNCVSSFLSFFLGGGGVNRFDVYFVSVKIQCNIWDK